MDEAERLCDRIAVVEAGRIVAIDTPQGLVARHDPWERVIFASDVEDLDWLLTVPGARSLNRRGPRVVLEGEGPLLALAAAALVAHGIVPRDLRVEEPKLEDVFLKLTGHLVED
jgi:ABC-2 type transport system ATP-binding protein